MLEKYERAVGARPLADEKEVHGVGRARILQAGRGTMREGL
jgi:hypothetical protein